jgi:hypothetical protein
MTRGVNESPWDSKTDTGSVHVHKSFDDEWLRHGIAGWDIEMKDISSPWLMTF